MKTIAEIRLENLKSLVRENGSQDKVAELAGSSAVYLSQLLNSAKDTKTGKPRQIGDDMARKLESGCAKEVGWLDNVHGAYIANPTNTTEVVAAEPVPVYQIRANSDPKTERLLQLWSELDARGKSDLLEKIDFFVAGRHPHRDGQAHTVARS